MRSFYEREDYVEHRRCTSTLRKIRNLNIIELLQNKTVLELGCGAESQDHLGKDYILE